MTHADRARRFALYFAPAPRSPLDEFGSRCLGRDAFTGQMPEPPRLGNITLARWRDITQSPRTYGLHATLKPPFRLAPGCRAHDLRAELCRFAAGQRAFIAPPLTFARISTFVAAVLRDQCPPFDELASACVRTFDAFRGEEPAADIARRRAADLTARQRALLERWGYPYVLDEWRFHMTFASGLSKTEGEEVVAALAKVAPPAALEPLHVDAVTLFEQAAADEPFEATERYAFEGAR